MRLGEVGGGFGGVRGDERVFLGAEIDLVLIEKTLAEGNLVQGIPVSDALDADLGERAIQLGDSLADIGAGYQRGKQIL